MLIDIVVPHGNETEFLIMAKRLGYDGVCFWYDTMPRTLPAGAVAVYAAVRGRRMPDALTIARSGDIRATIERDRPDVLFGAEETAQKGSLHHRVGGLDQVICPLAKANRVAIGFSFDGVLNRSPKTLGRITQNIGFCRKYRLPMLIASLASDPYRMRPPHDLAALFVSLGMHPTEARASLARAASIIERNRERAQGLHPTEGVRIMPK
jgi:hypothetical protein